MSAAHQDEESHSRSNLHRLSHDVEEDEMKDNNATATITTLLVGAAATSDSNPTYGSSTKHVDATSERSNRQQEREETQRTYTNRQKVWQENGSHSNSHTTTSQDWRHLPADMIFMIASCLESRSLARIESVDKFTHAAIEQRRTVLWRALAEKSENIRWLAAVERDQLLKFQQCLKMTQMKEDNPKQFCILRGRAIRGFHRRLLEAQQNRLHSAPFMKRSLALRWYDEVILPICLFILFALFIILLIYQLQTNDGSVTWMTMTPLMIFFGLILLSTLVICYIHCRGHSEERLSEGSVALYDTSHFIANNYAQESNSFMNCFLTAMIVPFGSVVTYRPLAREQVIKRFLLAAMIMLNLLTCVIFVSLRVTGEIYWNWALIFTPFFVAIGLITCTFCFKSIGGEAFALGLVMLLLASPILTFIILLTIYLNNGGFTSSLHLQYVFIPLYLIDAVTFLYTCVPTIGMLIGYLYFQCRHDDNFDDDTHFPLINVLASIGWLLCIGPFFYLKIVLGLRMDRDEKIVSNLALFLPLLLPVLVISSVAIFSMFYNGVFRSLIIRSETIQTALREAHEEDKVPSTVEEIENNDRFIVTIVEPIATPPPPPPPIHAVDDLPQVGMMVLH